jgi:epsilon-lactone hydrolase
MASLRARAVNSVLRHRIKRRLAACATPLEARKVFQATRFPSPFRVRFASAALGGVAGEWAESKGTRPAAATLFYLHGGTYIGMSPRTHRT